MNILNKFIEANGLDLSGDASELNSNCVIIAGYALYKEISREDMLELLAEEHLIDTATITELRRVYDFAEYNSYGDWWKSEEAKAAYTF